MLAKDFPLLLTNVVWEIMTDVPTIFAESDINCYIAFAPFVFLPGVLMATTYIIFRMECFLDLETWSFCEYAHFFSFWSLSRRLWTSWSIQGLDTVTNCNFFHLLFYIKFNKIFKIPMIVLNEQSQKKSSTITHSLHHSNMEFSTPPVSIGYTILTLLAEVG